MTILAIEHIVQSPDVLGGKPRIAGTRVRVQDVAAYHRNGSSIERIADAFDVTPAQIHAALSYYYDHREEIDADVAQQIANSEQFLADGHAITNAEAQKRIKDRSNLQE